MCKREFVNPLTILSRTRASQLERAAFLLSVDEFAFRLSLISYPGYPESLAYAIGRDM